MKESEFIPSDRSIEEMYDLEKKLGLTKLNYYDYYIKYKKPLKFLFG